MATNLQKSTVNLGIKYIKDINTTDIVEEIIFFEHAALSVCFTSVESTSFLNLLRMINDYIL